jgi:phosphoglycerate dehydrogenase-like enzyme
VKIQLLEPEGFPAAAVERLRGIGTVVLGPVEDTQDVEVVFTRLAKVIDRSFHDNYPALRRIVSPTTGLDHIDLDYFAARDVEVISLRGRTEFLDHIHATAEHTIALALALIRRLPAAATQVARGVWDRYPHKGRELFGKTVLIYGYGRIGRQVAALYGAFGCSVRAHDSVAGRVPPDLACDLAGILPATDILSIHVPLSAANERLVDAPLLAQLPARAIVINTSRGEVVDQAALFSALEAGALAGAALDVLAGEPAPLTADWLPRIAALGDRLVVTPHIAGFTFESLEAVEEHITDVLLRAVHAEA